MLPNSSLLMLSQASYYLPICVRFLNHHRTEPLYVCVCVCMYVYAEFPPHRALLLGCPCVKPHSAAKMLPTAHSSNNEAMRVFNLRTLAGAASSPASRLPLLERRHTRYRTGFQGNALYYGAVGPTCLATTGEPGRGWLVHHGNRGINPDRQLHWCVAPHSGGG